MSELIVREARDDDGPALKALARAVLADHPESGAEIPGQPSLDRPATNFEDRGGRIWVVMRGDEAVGALGLYRREKPDEFDLALIGLDRETRGLGLATALLAGAEAFAAASGGVSLGLWLDTRLDEAIVFMERHGFVREPGLKARQDGSGVLEVRFARAVEPSGTFSQQPSEARPAGAA